jgi:hypothetical protein
MYKKLPLSNVVVSGVAGGKGSTGGKWATKLIFKKMIIYTQKCLIIEIN